MKKLISLLLAFVLCLSLCACGSANNPPETNALVDTNAPTKSNTPYADALEEQAKDGSITNTSAWLMYSWITKNIGSFKNPSSVELTGNAYYCKGETSTDFKFFLVEIRAENSFGGNSVGYCKVTANGIVETDWEPAQTSPTFENEKVWKCGTAFLDNAFEEYMANNYG